MQQKRIDVGTKLGDDELDALSHQAAERERGFDQNAAAGSHLLILPNRSDSPRLREGPLWPPGSDYGNLEPGPNPLRAIVCSTMTSG